MLNLIVIVIFGIGFAFFATQNINPVTVNIGEYNWILPVYILALLSLLAGLLVSGIINVIDSIGSLFTIAGKDNKIKQTERSLENLHLRIQELQIENARLKAQRDTLEPNHEQKEIIHERMPVKQSSAQQLLNKLRHTFSY